MTRWLVLAALGALWGCLHGQDLVLRGEPVSVTVPLPADKERLAIRIDGIQPERDELVRLRVFVDLPTATARTPADDPHSAGEITLVPPGGDRKPAPRSSILPLPAGAIERMAKAASTRVTIVPLSEGVVRIAGVRIAKAE